MAHNFDPVTWNKSDTGESILVACKEGTHLLQQTDGKWSATRMTEKGSGEVRTGKLPDGKKFIATIEPMHGNEVVLNPENAEGKLWSDNRILLDDTLNQGHALATGDFLGLGYDQIAAGWRNPSTDTKKVGIKLYAPDKDGAWKILSLIDDNTMACEDIKAADLNGDGKPRPHRLRPCHQKPHHLLERKLTERGTSVRIFHSHFMKSLGRSSSILPLLRLPSPPRST